MLPLILIVGFAMATLGVALLLIGEVPFVAGKRIPALHSRLIGAVLIAFLPLALLIRQLSKLFFEADAIDGPVVTAAVFGLCWLVVIVILFRVVAPKRPPRKPSATAKPSKKNPFEQPAIEQADAQPRLKPATQSAPKRKSHRPTAEDRDPFDFS